MSREAAKKTLNEMITAYGAKLNPPDPAASDELRKLINEEKTPALREKFLDQVQNGHLTGLVPYEGKGGLYVPEKGIMYVSLAGLHPAATAEQTKLANAHDSSIPARSAENISNTMRMNLGHEIDHAASLQGTLDMKSALEAAAKEHSKNNNHDYTDALSDYNAKRRDAEATAEINGFNTLVAYVKQQNPNATLKDVYDASPGAMEAYFDIDETKKPAAEAYKLKEGLSDGKGGLDIPLDGNHVQTMGKYYYDKATFHLPNLKFKDNPLINDSPINYTQQAVCEGAKIIAKIDHEPKTVDLSKIIGAQRTDELVDKDGNNVLSSLKFTNRTLTLTSPGRQGELAPDSNPVTQTASASSPSPAESRFRSPSFEAFFNGDPGKAARDFAQTANLEQFKVNNQQASADIAVQGGQGNNQPPPPEEPKKLAEPDSPSEKEQEGWSR